MTKGELLIEDPPPSDDESESGEMIDETTTEISAVFRRKDVRLMVSLLVAVSFVAYFFAVNPSLWNNIFVYHPIFMAIAFMVALPELLCTVGDLHTRRVPFRDALEAHRHRAMVFKMLNVVGIVIIEWCKYSRSKVHFKSWHGILGVVCEVSQVLEILVGFFMQCRSAGRCCCTSISRICRSLHRFLALVVVLSGLASMFLGMFTHFAVATYGALGVRLFFAITPIVLTVWGFFSTH
uniref:Putative ferric reductase transmembrane protein n=1 Tax=Trypanosoma congolense (strain IL3000) TaxID=1068625 RepID=G0UNT0_TRYCI|nr:putative ferric reductase transmembrane protein [Trypanosoma congolense IL3000]